MLSTCQKTKKRKPNNNRVIIAAIVLLIVAIIALRFTMEKIMSKENDILLMAKTIVGEGRGEPFEGKLGIAYVIMNRLHYKGWFGSTIPQVISKPSQFSCWNKNDVNRKIASDPEKYVDNDIWEECKVAARLVYEERIADTTGGATHYMSNIRFMHISKAYTEHWVFNMIPVKVIGEHIFFIEDDSRRDY